MKKKGLIAIILSIIIFTTLSISIGVYIFLNSITPFGYTIQSAFPNLSFNSPLGIYSPDDDTDRLFILEKGGKIYTFNNTFTNSEKILFMDISDLISTSGEGGLLGLAFHPNFSLNGYFYLDYTNTTGDSVISQFKVDDNNFNFGNKSSQKIVLTVEQPFSNHNGGQIAFGPDNYLYIALGDGGSSGDPFGNSQNRSNLLGKILRIDINIDEPYSIPADNPFKGNTDGYREETYAYGLRNPWRFSFDPITGILWTGDVGQNAWEEIDIIENGKNYGWNAFEGNHPYSIGSNVTSVEFPIYEYDHSVGRSITGGFVYRGSQLPDLNGKYIYGDFGLGQIWALEYNDFDNLHNSILVDTNLQITSFGVDNRNELYLCAFDGKIYELITI